MDEIYKGIWDCFKLRIEEKFSNNPLEAILPSEVIKIMNQIEVEHFREWVDEFVAYVKERKEEAKQ